MTKLESRRLFALVKRIRKESLLADRTAARMYKNAGHSNDEEGTGDEGWHQVFRLDGMADGLRYAAEMLLDLLTAMEEKEKKK